MKSWRIAVGVALVILVGIQWIPTPRNLKNKVTVDDFVIRYTPPEHVSTLLKKACYDCHSNYTEYPWYSRVQPLALYLENHIKDGKAELNLSEFGEYSRRRQKSKLKSMTSQIKDGTMPLSSYTLIHRDANLSSENRKELVAWLTRLEEKL